MEKREIKYQEISILLDSFVEIIEQLKAEQTNVQKLIENTDAAFQKLQEKAQFEPGLKNPLLKIEQSLWMLKQKYPQLIQEIIQHSLNLKNNLWEL